MPSQADSTEQTVVVSVSDHRLSFIDREIAAGYASSRDQVIRIALEREMRGRAAQQVHQASVQARTRYADLLRRLGA